MLDYACIFTTGGALLWSHAFIAQTRGSNNLDLINIFIKSMLLESKSHEKKIFTVNEQQLRWSNHADLVFAVVYKTILQLDFVDKLLNMVKLKFVQDFYPKIPRQGDVFMTLSPEVCGSFWPAFQMVYKAWHEEVKSVKAAPK